VSPRSNLADDCVSDSLQLSRQLLAVTSKRKTERVSLGSVGELPPKSPAEIGGPVIENNLLQKIESTTGCDVTQG
jgi:hypothetical protein